jgi:hypothetical protein
MSGKEKGPAGSRRRFLLVTAVVGVAAILVVTIVAISIWSGADDNPAGGDIIDTSVGEMIVQPRDMPVGWAVASPYQPGYQGTLPGAYSEAGGVGYNLTQDGQERMYLIITLVKCVNTTQADQMYIGVEAAFNASKPGEWQAINFAEAALITNLTTTGMGPYEGKYLWFMEKNVLCGMIFTFKNGYTQTDQQLLDIARIQLEKIK